MLETGMSGVRGSRATGSWAGPGDRPGGNRGNGNQSSQRIGALEPMGPQAAREGLSNVDLINAGYYEFLGPDGHVWDLSALRPEHFGKV